MISWVDLFPPGQSIFFLALCERRENSNVSCVPYNKPAPKIKCKSRFLFGVFTTSSLGMRVRQSKNKLRSLCVSDDEITVELGVRRYNIAASTYCLLPTTTMLKDQVSFRV